MFKIPMENTNVQNSNGKYEMFKIPNGKYEMFNFPMENMKCSKFL